LLFDEFLNELLELRAARLRDEGLFEQDLIDQTVDVRLRGERQQVDGLGLKFTVLPHVFKNNSGRVESQQESLQLHL